MKRNSYKCAKTATFVIAAVTKMFRAEGFSLLNNLTFMNMVPSIVLQWEDCERDLFWWQRTVSTDKAVVQ